MEYYQWYRVTSTPGTREELAWVLDFGYIGYWRQDTSFMENNEQNPSERVVLPSSPALAHSTAGSWHIPI